MAMKGLPNILYDSLLLLNQLSSSRHSWPSISMFWTSLPASSDRILPFICENAGCFEAKRSSITPALWT